MKLRREDRGGDVWSSLVDVAVELVPGAQVACSGKMALLAREREEVIQAIAMRKRPRKGAFEMFHIDLLVFVRPLLPTARRRARALDVPSFSAPHALERLGASTRTDPAWPLPRPRGSVDDVFERQFLPEITDLLATDGEEFLNRHADIDTMLSRWRATPAYDYVSPQDREAYLRFVEHRQRLGGLARPPRQLLDSVEGFLRQGCFSTASPASLSAKILSNAQSYLETLNPSISWTTAADVAWAAVFQNEMYRERLGAPSGESAHVSQDVLRVLAAAGEALSADPDWLSTWDGWGREREECLEQIRLCVSGLRT